MKNEKLWCPASLLAESGHIYNSKIFTFFIVILHFDFLILNFFLS